MNRFFNLIIFCISSIALTLISAENTDPVIRVPANSNWCLGCICEAISNCNRSLKCEGDVCGLFRITWGYWADAGKPTVNNEDPKSKDAYANCTNDEVCAGTTVSNYLKRFAADCNGDGQVTCFDYAAIHLKGGWGGCRNQPLSGDYFNKFNDCERQISTLGVAPQS